MQNKSDAQLLREYAAQRSEPAFAEIVARHTALVYSAALRQTGSPELAREIAQSVFTDLARKARALAGTLSTDASLAGWLFRGTRFAGLKLLRDEHRRQTRERQFMEHFNPASESAPDWERIAPVLDEAMAELGDADHEAVLLRYFNNQDFHAVGLALGVSDDTAQKRVSRAVERLREFLAKRGVTVGASGLVVVISANAVQAAPIGLTAAITAAAALAGTTTITIATATATKAIVMTTLQKTLITATLAAAAGTGIYEARRVSQLQTQVQSLQQQQAPLVEQIQQLTRDREDATKKLAVLLGENEQLKRNTAQLPKLRGEVARLLNASLELMKSKATDANDPIEIVLKSWGDRVRLIKQRFERWPGKKTPELELLTDRDWLNEMASRELETEEDYREAMSVLRLTAKGKFSEIINKALEQYAQSNNDQSPSDLSQLTPYLQPPLDSFLQDYEIAKPGTVHPPKPGSPNSERAEVWAMIEKGTANRDASVHANKDYDRFIIIYRGGWFAYGPE